MFVRKSTYDEVASDARHYRNLANKILAEKIALRVALNEILEQRTQYPNATVTRMLNIAEKALGE